MAEKNITGNIDYVGSFKDLMYNTYAGRIIVASAVIAGLVLGYRAIDSHLIKQPEPIEQRQDIGNKKPDIFIERDGVK